MAQHASNDLPDVSSVKAIADLAQKAHEAQIIQVPTDGLGAGLPQSVPVLYDPRTGQIHALTHDIEKYRQAPRAREGSAVALTLASFVDLVIRHADEGSAIFAETRWPNPKLTAVIDYHDVAKQPRHGRHRIVYDFPITDELKAWQAMNGKAMAQDAFAAFIEEHLSDLASPFDGERDEFERLFKEKFGTPSEILSLSRELEVLVGHHVKNKVRLSSGESEIVFVEEHTDKSGQKVVVPGIFMVSVPAFVDGEPVRIPARLRYRVADGGLKWFYQLYRWEFWLRERVQQDLGKAADATSLPAFEGVPEKSLTA